MNLPAENTLQPLLIADAREAAHRASELQRTVEDQIREASRSLADAERQYRMKLTTRIMELHAQDQVANRYQCSECRERPAVNGGRCSRCRGESMLDSQEGR